MDAIDTQLNRVAAYIAAGGITLSRAAELTGLHRNGIAKILRTRKGRFDTLRRLSALVPDDFHVPSEDGSAEGAELGSNAQKSGHSATKNYVESAA